MTLTQLRENARRQRNVQMLREHLLHGWTYPQLADKYDMTARSVGGILRRLVFQYEHRPDLYGLPDDIAAKLKKMGEP